MKKVLYVFLLLPFLWQCDGLDNFFKPANFGDGIVPNQDTTKRWSIHSEFNIDDLSRTTVLDSPSYTSNIPKTYLTDDKYVFYGQITENRDIATTSADHRRNIWILLEIREVGGKIKINSANTASSSSVVSPLDLYNARTELPTTVLTTGVNIKSIGLWPKYSRLTHENLATTNTSQFNYVNSLQSTLYTNILPEEYSLLTGTSGIGNEIKSSTPISSLKTIVSGKTWDSVNYPGFTPISATNNYNYHFFDNFTLNASLIPITGATASPFYGWDIWTFNGFTATDGVVTEHYLYTYRAPTLFLRVNALPPIGTAPAAGEQLDLLRLALRNDLAGGAIGPNETFANLIRLSIAP